MFEDITDLFLSIIEQAGSYDIAQSEFEKLTDEDRSLQQQYADWCDENGYSIRNGFRNFCEEYHNSRNSAMDSLSDYDEW